MIKSKKHLSSLLKVPYPELVKITNKINRFYYKKEEVKEKKDGTPKLDKDGNPRIRTLYPSKGKLKEIQAIIKNAILSKLTLSQGVYGGVKGKDSVRNAKVHKGKKYKFVTDLKDFYPSVRPKMVYQALIRYGFSCDIASMLTKLTTYKNQVPQGAPTSTHVTNIALSDLDDYMTGLCSKRNISYTRYVDDMTFSSQQCFKNVLPEIITAIEKYGLKLSHRKTAYAAGSIMITGARVRNNCLSVSDEMNDKLNHPERFKERQIQGHKAYTKRVKAM